MNIPEPLQADIARNASSEVEGVVPPSVLVVRSVTKAFGATRALAGADLSVQRGEIHGLVGHNGSGKSTLVKILAGYYERDGGVIEIQGRSLPRRVSVEDVRAMGIGFVHQDLALVPNLSVADNIGFSARGFVSVRGGLISWKDHIERTRRLTRRMGLLVDPLTLVADLSAAEQTLVAISRSLGEYDNETLLVLDEPTARLPQHEVGRLMAALHRLAAAGAAILYISHRLDDVLEICDRITVFRDGRTVATLRARDETHDSLVRVMTGMKLASAPELSPKQPGPSAAARNRTVLEFRDVDSGRLSGLNLELREGEVLVLTGAVGAGTEGVGRLAFGLDRPSHGEVLLDGVPRPLLDPYAARTHGVAYVSSDRAGKACFGKLSVDDNIQAHGTGRLPSLGYASAQRSLRESEIVVMNLGIRPTDPRVAFDSLSGGSQQKVLIAKWLRTHPRVLVVEEPTQGVDVTSRQGLYALVREAVAGGLAVLWLTTDLEEVPTVADRALVLHNGRIVAEFQRGDMPVHALTKAVLAGAVA